MRIFFAREIWISDNMSREVADESKKNDRAVDLSIERPHASCFAIATWRLLRAERSHGVANRAAGCARLRDTSGAKPMSDVMTDEQMQYDAPVAGSTTQSHSALPGADARLGAYDCCPFDRVANMRMLRVSLSSPVDCMIEFVGASLYIHTRMKK
jgi:hypothetical protein